MTLNAQMNGMMNETLNVSGALLVKLFGRERDESRRFGERAAAIRDIGIRQALIGRWFFLGHRPGQLDRHGDGVLDGRLPGADGRA